MLNGNDDQKARFLPDLIDLIGNHTIDPGKVFDLTLPLDQAAEGDKAMDERRAVKTLLQVFKSIYGLCRERLGRAHASFAGQVLSLRARPRCYIRRWIDAMERL